MGTKSSFTPRKTGTVSPTQGINAAVATSGDAVQDELGEMQGAKIKSGAQSHARLTVKHCVAFRSKILVLDLGSPAFRFLPRRARLTRHASQEGHQK